MSDSTTWVGMDVHKKNILTVSISGDSGTVLARWETPNTAKDKERLAARIAGLGKARCVYAAGRSSPTRASRARQLRTDHCHAVKPAHISMITADIAAPRATAKGKKRNGSKYHLTPVAPYQRSG